MEFFDIYCDDTLSLYPEYILLNYLKWASDILNCKKSWDIDSLCIGLDRLDLDQQNDVEHNSFENSVCLDNAEVRNILLSDIQTKKCCGIFVKVLLETLCKNIRNFKKGNYQEILSFVKTISCFVKACEKNNIVTVLLETQLKQILTDLFCILETANSINFSVKGPVYQLIVKVIVSFRNVEFVRRFIVMELSKRLSSFHNVMLKTPTNNFDISSYEILLLYLMILKDVLEYDLQKLLLMPIKETKKEDKILMAVNQNLRDMLDKLPNYAALPVQDCLSLFF